MTCNLFRKRGVPVLAYTTSDGALQWPCFLVVKHSEARMQATISLQSSIPIHGFDEEQNFTFVYNADNLVPGQISLNHSAMALPQARHGEIARQGNPQLKTLSLTLKKPCPVWCPSSSGSIAPKGGFDSSFRQFVELARATRIHILFDYNWLHRNKQARLQRLISHPEELTAFTIDNYANRFRQADWSTFSPIQDEVSEVPPPYNGAPDRSFREAVNKRPRQASTSSLPDYPPPKRVLLSPAPIYTPLSTPSPKPTYFPAGYAPAYAPSPTEKATTVGTPSPRLHSSPVIYAPDFQDSVTNAVEAVLPGVLQALLPDMLSQLFATPSLSPSSPSSLNRIPKPTPTPRSVSSLRALLSARVAAYAEAQLQNIYDETLDRAIDIRNAADVEFHEVLEDQKFDVTTVKDDSITEVNLAFDERLGDFEDTTAGILAGVEERAEMVFINVCDRLDGLVGREKTFLMRERELLEGDRRRFEEMRRSAQQTATGGRNRRATSLPF